MREGQRPCSLFQSVQKCEWALLSRIRGIARPEQARQGKVLVFHADPDLEWALDPLRGLLTHSFNPNRSRSWETINGEDARGSGYLDFLEAHFRLYRDHKRVVIEGVK